MPEPAGLVPAGFRPAWWLPGPHAQTLFAGLLRPRPAARMTRERIELPDGDFVDADWSARAPASGPVVVLLHGLEGSSSSRYIAGMMRALDRAGMRSVVLHFRGCSGDANRLAVGYHSGLTDDLRFFLERLRAREPELPIGAVGFSLGGNVLLKYLGEEGSHARIAGAAAVSVPLDLGTCAAAMSRGTGRFYQGFLLRQLTRHLKRKRRRVAVPVDHGTARAARSLRAFDEAVTAPLHGFADADDYYARSSSRRFLRAIRVPTLVVHAADDPFTSRAVIPAGEELSDAVRFEHSERGGHIGFVTGSRPWRPVYWLEQRVPAWLEAALGAAQRS